MLLTAEERLNAGLVRMPNGCLEWTMGTTSDGYGRMSVNGKPMLTHRFAWTLAHGAIPAGMFVLHHCDNPPCCDAEKCLFLGTRKENNADRDAKGRGRAGEFNAAKTHCKFGHEFAGANLYVTPDGKRFCRACHVIREAKRRVEKPPTAEQLAHRKAYHAARYLARKSERAELTHGVASSTPHATHGH